MQCHTIFTIKLANTINNGENERFFRYVVDSSLVVGKWEGEGGIESIQKRRRKKFFLSIPISETKSTFVERRQEHTQSLLELKQLFSKCSNRP